MYKRLDNRKWLYKRYVTEMQSITQIAGEVGCDKSTVARALRRHGIEVRRRTSKFVKLNDKDWLRQAYVEQGRSLNSIAGECGTTPGNVASHLDTLDIKRRTSSEGLKLKFPKGRTMENHPNWKGGRRKTRSGYIWIYVPKHPKATGHGYIQEHRLIAENILGRYLSSDEIVHHIDGDKTNNVPENLEVMSRGDHFRLHYNSYQEMQTLKIKVKELEAENQRLRKTIDE